jgi:hypothetical protein
LIYNISKMFDEDIDAEKEKAFDEFTKEYG